MIPRSDCSVLKNICVITERANIGERAELVLEIMSLHLDILSLKVFGRQFEKNGLTA